MVKLRRYTTIQYRAFKASKPGAEVRLTSTLEARYLVELIEGNGELGSGVEGNVRNGGMIFSWPRNTVGLKRDQLAAYWADFNQDTSERVSTSLRSHVTAINRYLMSGSGGRESLTLSPTAINLGGVPQVFILCQFHAFSLEKNASKLVEFGQKGHQTPGVSTFFRVFPSNHFTDENLS